MLEPDSPEVAEDVGAAPSSVVVRAAEPATGDRVGRYTVLDTLGRGGMGVVVSAHDPVLDRRVAIKLVRAADAGSAEEHRARLVREARAMAKIRHPNVVSVYEVGEHEGQVYLAMEEVEGGTLRGRYREEAYRWRQVLADFAAAGRGLAAAHDAGVVHRDFKPENVFVDRDGRVLVGDFGLVDAGASAGGPADGDEPLRERLTRGDVVVGTPAYMAPEQHTGEGVDARADQFAFCVALYEALFGTLPFTGETRRDYVRAIARGEIAAPPAERKVPVWLWETIRKGLSADPSQRYPSMRALLADLGSDPRRQWWHGRRERAVAFVGAGGFLVIWAAALLGLDVELSYALHYATNLTFLGIVAGFVLVGRRAFVRTPMNQKAMGVALAGGLVPVALVFGADAAGITAAELGALHLVTIGGMLAVVTATLDRRFGFSAGLYLLGFLAVATWPPILLPLLLLCHTVAAVTLFVAYVGLRRRDDGS